MSAKTMPAVYETFEELFGRKASEKELIGVISRYERNSLLWMCSEIVARVQLWARPALHNRANYLAYLRDLFDASTGQRLLRASTSSFPIRLLFHRRQIGLVAKLALKHGDGNVDARLHRSELGVIFLMANDQLHHGLLNLRPASEANERDTNLRWSRKCSRFMKDLRQTLQASSHGGI